MEDFQFNRIHGITDPKDIEIAPRPVQVWQLVGEETATMARDEADARDKIARLKGVERLPDEAKVVRIR